jgi:hypothetical protein
MKNNSILALAFGIALGGAVAALAQDAPKHVVTKSSTTVNVSTINGQSVVTVNGKQVYTGPVKGQVSTRSRNVNGVEYAAAFDGDTVLWENVPGAAQKLAAEGVEPGLPDHARIIELHQQSAKGQAGGKGGAHGSGKSSGTSSSSSTSTAGNVTVRTVNGDSVVVYQGKEIPLGQTKGALVVKSKNLHGVEYSAVLEGDKVIWENIPGAADKVR